MTIFLVWAILAIRSNIPEPSNVTPLTSPSRQASHSEQANVKPVAATNDGSAQSKGNPPQKITNTIAPESKYRAAVVKNNDKLISKAGAVYPLRVYRPLLSPNDPYGNQWWTSSTGLNLSWDIPAGSKQTTIAVIDTGFALNHQEFTGRWATNSGESGSTAQENPSKLNCTDQGLSLSRACNNIDDDFDGIVDNETGVTTSQNPSWLNCSDQAVALNKTCNRLDDDGNGLVDDYRGWDFSNFDPSVQAGEINPDGAGTRHGTMVAGILGATGNNNVGIAGVNWQTKILPIQALDDDGYGDSYTVGNAIYYAADQGVDLISISLGTDFEDPYLRQAMFYAQEKGVLIVASSGNDGCDCIVYPANYPEVLAVGASNSSNNISSFSSFGANLDIVAPGQDMATSYWTKTNQTSSYVSGAAGTSFSAPLVSGILGLLRSHQPNASWDELIGILFENSDRKNLSAGSPRSNSFGFGFIKTNQALTRASSPYSLPINYKFSGDILGTEGIRRCEGSLIPGSFLYELTRSGQVKYTINRYEIRKAENNSWTSKQLFGVCIGLPSDTPDILRLISLNQEIRDQPIK